MIAKRATDKAALFFKTNLWPVALGRFGLGLFLLRARILALGADVAIDELDHGQGGSNPAFFCSGKAGLLRRFAPRNYGDKSAPCRSGDICYIARIMMMKTTIASVFFLSR